MFKDQINSQDSAWKGYEKILFRLAFIYFFLQVFPLDWKYYRHLFSINWLDAGFAELFQVAKYTPQFVSGSYNSQDWGLATFADWLFIFIVAVAGTVIWTLLDKKTEAYRRLYAWLRILVRYRLGIALIAYGFLKLFAIQAPAPSLSSLNTPYGDFTTWKLFSLSLGIVPGYQAFLGAVELIAGILLLFRRTTVIGATIIIFFTGNVFMSNLAYEGGEVVYSFYLVTLALFLIVYDLQRIISLIVLHVPVAPAKPALIWTDQLKRVRFVLKSALVLVFVVIYGFSAHGAAVKGGYHFTHDKGIKGLKGLYTVISFKLNGEDRPYSLTDSLRWQDVVFEKWATFSVKVNHSDVVSNDNIESVPVGLERSSFESTGTRGRVYFNFKADTVQQTLSLINTSVHEKTTADAALDKTSALSRNANQAADGLLKYQLAADSTVLISGIVNGEQVEAVLQKNPKKYLLKAAEKGRSRGLKL
ncbi:DoxX family protein [Pedobacter sp. MC2016-15]|uniref:DoxX family protein n=1 Tax=Pedobacter sp. MC2016-15 TaxID=2994473 RepID=UPI002246E5DC|nr:DoxX family protein [Pedobacter sp. MC2016-15]MCX2477818.1 DoxX family protein [Pedobacter sp. MC2016-15]